MTKVFLLLAVLAVVALIALVVMLALRSRRREVGEADRPRTRPPTPPPQAPPSPGEGPPVEGPPGEKPPVPSDREAEGPSLSGAVTQVPPEALPPLESAPTVEIEEAVAPRRRFRDRLSRARGTFSTALSSMLGRKAIDEETWEDLEEALVRCDIGIDLATRILQDLEARARRDGIREPAEIIGLLKEELVMLLSGADRTLHTNADGLSTWLMVGVNGAGKTTTIAKLASRRTGEGDKVVLAAADTFRAAAAEQLEIWAERTGAHLVRGQEGADPASIVFDAVDAARSRAAELVIVDTAGRLHTKVNLMDELSKIRRVVDKANGGLTEVLLVIDATTGQNGLEQARQFTEAVGVTGIVLTKLDGSARGGIVLAVETELDIPVKLVGLGEQAEDLLDFDPEYFVEALFE